MIATMPDGRLVRLIPQDGPPTEPGLYLAEYTPLHGLRHTVAREVFRHSAGSLILGADETRLEWWARLVFAAPAGSAAGVTLGGGLIRGATVDGEANDQRGEGAGAAEPSTPGREGEPDWWTLTTVPRVDLTLLLKERDDLRERVADLDRQLEECNRMRVDALHRATAGELAAVMASEGRKSAEAAFNRACERAEAAEAKVSDLNGYCAALADRLVPGHRGLLATAVESTLARIADLERALADADGCRQLALGRAEQAEARVAELEAERRWVPVGEHLPDEGVEVLVRRARLDGTRYVCARKWQPAKPSWVPDSEPTPLGVWAGAMGWAPVNAGDHWRPLPAGPEVAP